MLSLSTLYGWVPYCFMKSTISVFLFRLFYISFSCWLYASNKLFLHGLLYFTPIQLIQDTLDISLKNSPSVHFITIKNTLIHYLFSKNIGLFLGSLFFYSVVQTKMRVDWPGILDSIYFDNFTYKIHRFLKTL